MEKKTKLSPEDFFTVTYGIKLPAGVSPERFAQDIAEEQTVEIPHKHIPQQLFDNGIVGQVVTILQADDGRFTVKIRYRNDTTGFSAPQLLNVLFGNISLKKGIRITGLECSEKMYAAFRGPAFGIEGVRSLVGVYGRPLLCTALKPMGLSNTELAAMAGVCARSGVDLIKDDHGIGDQPFCRFEDRVARVSETIAAADAQTGNVTVYFPNLCGPREEIERQVECAVRCGIRAVLLAPQLVGFDTIHDLAEKYRLVVMAHPAFTGSLFTCATTGIVPELFLGTFFRMIGADISIFPSWGGRFPFTRRECTAIAEALTYNLPPLKRALPAPAGGITQDRIAAIAEAYGSESALLVGGALLGGSDDMHRSISSFRDALGTYFKEERRAPEMPFASSCEIRSPLEGMNRISPLLKYENYHWKGRRTTEYKTEDTAVFADIRRTELIGKSGENTAFDLRYFEIDPKGYSSFEKHQHEHVIIGVRGTGVQVKNGERFTIRPNDIAYIKSWEPHQLRNEGTESFGFYCIVDHERDQPQAVGGDDGTGMLRQDNVD
ncbi:MAG: cupin domain-containing protein [Chitinispirillaceae bacterium]|nr:cupin domain-containing protein [Chitinispirillaceae bacterium]